MFCKIILAAIILNLTSATEFRLNDCGGNQFRCLKHQFEREFRKVLRTLQESNTSIAELNSSSVQKDILIQRIASQQADINEIQHQQSLLLADSNAQIAMLTSKVEALEFQVNQSKNFELNTIQYVNNLETDIKGNLSKVREDFERSFGVIRSNMTDIYLYIDECASNPCLNGATCDDFVNSYTCSCAPGWRGEHCGTDIDECANNPCLNGATCNDFINYFECTCDMGWQGEICEADIDECASNPCLNGATCNDFTNYFECTCDMGWQGEICEDNVDECASNPCYSGGSCIDLVNRFECSCPPNLYGERCDVSGGPFNVSLTNVTYGFVHVYDPQRQQWGTICNLHRFGRINKNICNVVCRKLGFRSGIFVDCRSGPSTMPILLDNVQCTGSEADISQCRYDREHGCDDHIHDQACDCDDDGSSRCSDFGREVRASLTRGTYGHIKLSYPWYENYGIANALDSRDDNNIVCTVVCRELGFNIGVYVDCGPQEGNLYPRRETFSCKGNESRLDQCDQPLHYPYIDSDQPLYFPEFVTEHPLDFPEFVTEQPLDFPDIVTEQPLDFPDIVTELPLDFPDIVTEWPLDFPDIVTELPLNFPDFEPLHFYFFESDDLAGCNCHGGITCQPP